MEKSLDTDVVVVGAGPVGLLLAGLLRTGGTRVTVVERLAEPTTESRASTLNSRSMEILGELGLLEPLGPPSPGGTGHFGGIALDLECAGDTPFPGQWKAPQTRLEKVLGAWARDLGAVVLRGRELTGVRQERERITADSVAGRESSSITARYLVGCDGHDSTVRRLCGFGFPGAPATRELLRADIAGVDVRNRRFERHPGGMAVAARGPGGVTRFMVHEHGSTPRDRNGPPDFTELVEAWRRVTGEDIGRGVPVWLNAFDDECRQADRYRRGRVLLAGDAAHVQLPVGGQALNLGLQDAADLGWKLAAQVRGEAPAGLLDTYDTERRPVGARVQKAVRAQAQILLGDHRTEPVRTVFGELLELDTVRRHLASMVSGLDTHREPPLVLAFGTTTERRIPMGKLSGKTALVTGSSRGIGRATAVRLAREGALVAVHYANDADSASETVEIVEKEGGRAFAVQAELGLPGDVHALFLGLEEGLKERTGETTLDILVNNAGVMGGASPEEITPERFDRLISVNAKAPFFIAQRALRSMPDGGRIINISSGLTKFANPQEVVYAMSKGAVEQIALHLAKHLGPRRITVNSVAPGITNNGGPVFDIPEAVEQMAGLSAFGRVGETGDVADIVAFLATEEARWITGAFIDATGGTLLG